MEKKDILKYSMYFAGVVLVAVVIYLLLRPAKKSRACPTGMSNAAACGGKCAPSDCPAQNIDCNGAGLFAQCSCGTGQIYCKGKDGAMGCFDSTIFQCNGADRALGCVKGGTVCFGTTGNTASCCDPVKGCDGVTGYCANCSGPNTCGTTCCLATETCMDDKRACCPTANYISAAQSATGTNQCCGTPGLKADGTWTYTDSQNKRVCCDNGGWDPETKTCGVVCSGKNAATKKICTANQVCDATPYATDLTKSGLCITPGCTWSPVNYYPETSGNYNNPDCLAKAAYLPHCECTSAADCSNCALSYYGNVKAVKCSEIEANVDKGTYYRYIKTQETSGNLCGEDDCEKRLATETGAEKFKFEKSGGKNICMVSTTADRDCDCCGSPENCKAMGCPPPSLKADFPCPGLPVVLEDVCPYNTGSGCTGDFQRNPVPPKRIV